MSFGPPNNVSHMFNQSNTEVRWFEGRCVLGHGVLCFTLFCSSRQDSKITRWVCRRLNESTYPQSRKCKCYHLLRKRVQIGSPYCVGRRKNRLRFVYYETCFPYFINDKKSLVCWNIYKFIRRLKHTCQRCMSDRLWQKGEGGSGSQITKNIFIVMWSARLNHLVVTGPSLVPHTRYAAAECRGSQND
jgi:hypothetical protein